VVVAVVLLAGFVVAVDPGLVVTVVAVVSVLAVVDDCALDGAADAAVEEGAAADDAADDDDEPAGFVVVAFVVGVDARVVDFLPPRSRGWAIASATPATRTAMAAISRSGARRFSVTTSLGTPHRGKSHHDESG
jgi:hypothetical protein